MAGAATPRLNATLMAFIEWEGAVQPWPGAIFESGGCRADRDKFGILATGVAAASSLMQAAEDPDQRQNWKRYSQQPQQ